MLTLDHLLIDQGVLDARFACDVARCKGACCTLPGGAGAPLRDEEVQLVRDAVDAARPYLSERSLRHLDTHGPVERVGPNWATSCIDDRDCVFVTYANDVAICSIEKAWHAGESTFRKPLSCHLFPIRIANFGGPYVHYEQFDECAPGRELGEKENVLLVESVRDALVRAFGEELTQRMIDATKEGETK